MSSRRAHGVGLALLGLALARPIAAQDGPSAESAPPSGPAEIIRRAGAARQARENNALPTGHPEVTPDQEAAAAEPVGDDPHAHTDGAPALARRPLASAEPSTQLAAGSVRVRVVDPNEQPIAGADLQLGTMAQESGRTSVAATTGSDGVHVFEKLATGDKQAYRVNVLYQGAKYSSTPFRLPTDRGYEVVIRRLPTTHDTRELVLYVGATSVELKDERLKIVQQARLINIGSQTYVFPEAGQLVRLPKDAMAFQAEEIMTDQHMREEKGQGVRITGSIPPGEVTLTWGFDVPREEDSADYSFELPWVTFAYRVLVDAAPGMTVNVDEMPPAELHEDNGRRFMVTEIVKRVGEQPLRRVNIHVRGIPGPGPLRFIAVFLAAVLLAGGVFLARRSEAAPAGANAEVLGQRREQLLARAKELAAERTRGDIGPEFHAHALSQLEDEMAALLYEQARARR